MRKGRDRNFSHSVSEVSYSSPDDGILHFRLCHICLHLNEGESDINRCELCQQYLTIERVVRRNPGLLRRAKRREEEEEEESMRAEGGRPNGLYGLAVVW